MAPYEDRVRTILTVIAAPHWGGVHVVVERTSPFFAEAGFRRIVAMPVAHEQSAERLRAAGCEVVPVSLGRPRKTLHPSPHIGFISGFARETSALRALMIERGVDIVEVAGLLNFQPVAAARKLGKPLVWQMHSTLAPRPLRTAVGAMAMRTADAVMTSGRAMARRHGGLDPERVIPFCAPVDTARFAPDAAARARMRQHFGYGDADIVVGTLGNRGWQKRHEYILSLAEGLGDSRFRFVIAGTAVDTGDSYYRKKVMEPLRARGLEDRVSVVDQAHPAEELMNAFDIFILPSVAEGASLVTAEAMATGLPIVASDVGSLGDIVATGVNGFLCDVDSPDQFRSALEALADGETRLRMGAASRARAVEEMSDKACAEAHFAAYRQALAARCR